MSSHINLCFILETIYRDRYSNRYLNFKHKNSQAQQLQYKPAIYVCIYI